MLKDEDTEKRKTTIYTEMHLGRQSDSEAEILEEMYSRIDKFDLGMTSGPQARNTIFQEIPQQHLSPTDEINRETIREGLESFSEIQNEADFSPWIEEKSKKARKKVYKNNKTHKKGSRTTMGDDTLM